MARLVARLAVVGRQVAHHVEGQVTRRSVMEVVDMSALADRRSGAGGDGGGGGGSHSDSGSNDGNRGTCSSNGGGGRGGCSGGVGGDNINNTIAPSASISIGVHISINSSTIINSLIGTRSPISIGRLISASAQRSQRHQHPSVRCGVSMCECVCTLLSS